MHFSHLSAVALIAAVVWQPVAGAEGTCDGKPCLPVGEDQRCVKTASGTVVCGPAPRDPGDCVVNPEGVVVCGEAVPKQPVVWHAPRSPSDTLHSGYTRTQIGYNENTSDVRMEYRTLGGTGLRVSAFAYGSWITFSHQLGKAKATQLMRAAFTAGINLFDTAEAYAGGDAERIMGEVIADGIADGFWRRQDLVITTKVFWGRPVRSVNDVGLSRKHVIEGVLGSLQRLQLDYVDIVYAHRPDSHTPLEETVRAFDFLINSGKAMYWGTSEWPASRIVEAVAIADRLGLVGPVVEQPEYSLLHRSRVELEYADLFRSSRGYGSTVYSALGLGILTGKYNDGIPADSRFTVSEYESLKRSALDGTRFGTWDELIEKVRRLGAVAESLGASPAQLALAWCLKNPAVSSVILGATRVEQLQENVAALALLPRMTPAVMARIDEVMDNAVAVPDVDYVAREMRNAKLRFAV